MIRRSHKLHSTTTPTAHDGRQLVGATLEADSRRTLRAGGELEARNEEKEAHWTPDALTAAAHGEEDELKGKLNG